MADQRVTEVVRIADPTTNSQMAAVDASGRLSVSINASTATVTVDTELPAAVALSDTLANPTAPAVGAYTLGWDGTQWKRIWGIKDGDAVAAGAIGFLTFGTDGSNYQALSVNSSGRLQIDVISGGSETTPTTPVTDNANSTNTAAGASSNLDSTDVGGTTQKLWGIEVGSSVPYKAIIQLVENSVVVATLTTLFGEAGSTEIYKPPHRDFAARAFSANAGFDGFRAVITNLDTSEAADLYASFHYAQN